MDNNIDIRVYMSAVDELKRNPVRGPGGTYHVKNGMIYCGYSVIGTDGFSTSEHYRNIFH